MLVISHLTGHLDFRLSRPENRRICTASPQPDPSQVLRLNTRTCLHRLVMRSAVSPPDGWLPGAANSRTDAPWVTCAILFAAAGMAPDLDLLFGPPPRTYRLGAALARRASSPMLATRHRRYLAIAVGRRLASHTLLDWLGTDSVAADRHHGAVAVQPRVLPVERPHLSRDLAAVLAAGASGRTIVRAAGARC